MAAVHVRALPAAAVRITLDFVAVSFKENRMNVWLYLFIVIAGILQACAAPMNGQLYKSLQNPWLTALVSFALVVCVFLCLSACLPRPLPSIEGIAAMPWWAPLGGLIGSVAVYSGLTLVGKVGNGPFTALTVTAALLTSIAIDHFGFLRMEVHPCGLWRAVGAVLMVAGVALIARF
jgi:transporter family-2 protein